MAIADTKVYQIALAGDGAAVFNGLGVCVKTGTIEECLDYLRSALTNEY